MLRSWLVAIVAPLLLTGCLWAPGKFDSRLDIHKNGSFSLAYKGEIMFVSDESTDKGTPWSDDMAHCAVDEEPSLQQVGGEERACTAAEIASLKTEYEKNEAERMASKRKQADEMARAFGLAGTDDASMRRFAEKMMKYKGWRSVAYKGNSTFDVDYRIEGRLDQDYVFPTIPDTDLIMPFVAIRRRTDGSVLVTAPGFAGGEGPFMARARMMGAGAGEKSGTDKMRADGNFIIVTDGDVLTNNTENGPAADPGGKALTWHVTPSTTKTPEALIRL